MTFENIKKALGAVGLYGEEAANLDAELKAYSDELDRLDAAAQAYMNEAFIDTATDLGLSAYEELFGPAMSDLSYAERRRRLKLRFGLGGGDFTPAGIRKALDSFGLSYVISEYPRYNRLSITAQTDYPKAAQEFIKREVGKIVPAHIEYQLVFNTATWELLDARDKTFVQLDSEDLTWDQIDELPADIS